MAREKEMNLLVVTQKVNAEDAILGFFVQWIEGLARRVNRVFVLALETGPHELPENVEVISLGKDRGASTLSMLVKFNRTLLRLCRKHKPLAVLAHMVPRYVLYAAPVACVHRVPIDLWYTHKGVDKYLRMAHPFLRHAFTASEESFRMESGKKIVTGHGVDTDLFRPGSTKGEGLVTVGRITPSKDQKVLVEALALIEGRRDVLKTSIVGEPLLDSDRRYLGELEAVIRKDGLDDVVTFVGTVPHKRLVDHYRAARIMVNASHTGSVDKVVLEAMASGALPLTCNESFIPLLGDLAEGLVFAKRDARDLAGKIERLLDLGEEERSTLSERLRNIVKEDHNLDVLMDRLVREMSA